MVFLKKIKFEIKLVTIFYPGLVAWAIAQIILLGYGIYMSYEAYQLAVTHINKEILDNAAAYSTCQHDVTNVAEKITEARRISADVDNMDSRMNFINKKLETLRKQNYVGVNAYKDMADNVELMKKLSDKYAVLAKERVIYLKNTNIIAVEPLVHEYHNLVTDTELLKEKAIMLLAEKQELQNKPILPQGAVFKAPIIVGVSVCVGLAIFSMAGGSEPPTSA